MTYPDYEGYEELSRFTPGQLQSYRQMLLLKTQPQVDFIRNHVRALSQRDLTVVEIGSGNGRLLVSLAKQNLLESGWGFDISQSRTEFARAWARDEYLWNLGFSNQDILKMTTGWCVDLAVCITGCFQYFYPIDPGAPHQVLSWMRNSATYALFELYKRPPMGRTWKKLPEGDPWKYLLDEYYDNGDWVEHTKTFIGHNGTEDVRKENLAYYPLQTFLRHLFRAGFKTVHWAKEDSTTIVVLVS